MGIGLVCGRKISRKSPAEKVRGVYGQMSFHTFWSKFSSTIWRRWRYLIYSSLPIDRSSHQGYSGVLRNFAKFVGNHLCQSLFFNKVAGLRATTLLKKRLWHRCFPVNFTKFLRTPFLQNTSGRLLLNRI